MNETKLTKKLREYIITSIKDPFEAEAYWDAALEENLSIFENAKNNVAIALNYGYLRRVDLFAVCKGNNTGAIYFAISAQGDATGGWFDRNGKIVVEQSGRFQKDYKTGQYHLSLDFPKTVHAELLKKLTAQEEKHRACLLK